MSREGTAATPEPTVRSVAAQFPAWLLRNSREALISVVVAGVLGYLLSLWLLVVHYQGYLQATNGAPVPGAHNEVRGTVFWAILSVVLFGFYGYWRSVGTERLREDVASLPATLRSLFQSAGASARVYLLWGAGVTLLAEQLLSPAIGAALGVGLLAIIPGLLGRLVETVLLRAYAQVVARVAPTREHRPPPAASMSLAMVGGGGALLVGAIVDNRPVLVLAALGCGVAAFLLSRQAAPGTGLLLVAIIAAAWALVPALARATDGGYVECGSDPVRWLTHCQGNTEVLARSLLPAIASGVTGPLGLFLGYLSAAPPPAAPPASPRPVEAPRPERPGPSQTAGAAEDAVRTAAAEDDHAVGEGGEPPEPAPSEPAPTHTAEPQSVTLPDPLEHFSHETPVGQGMSAFEHAMGEREREGAGGPPGWEPTHIVAAPGQPAWNTPDGTPPPVAWLEDRLEVRVTLWASDWAEVLCSNGWHGWTDGRRLVPIRSDTHGRS